MLKFRANINKIIMMNLEDLSVTKILTKNEMESILLKIKMGILESHVDVSFKAEVESFLSHQNIKVLAEKCHLRYTSDLEFMKVPSFFRKCWPYLVPMILSGTMTFIWLMLDIFKGFEHWNLLMGLKGIYIAMVCFGSKKLHHKYQKSNHSIYFKESEILRSKIFGLIYENFNVLYKTGSKHAS